MYKLIKLTLSVVLPVILVVTTALIGKNHLYKDSKNPENYGEIRVVSGIEKNKKIKILEEFFDKYKSPLKENADDFVDVSEKYGMDFRLLPAISCMESTCGKFMIPNTYNPFGWGIYGTHYIAFNSFDEAIEEVGKGISTKYVAKGFETVEEIAPIYTPPNYVHWSSGVNFFINKMDEIEQKQMLADSLISMR